jgi:hypothetical protein
MTKPSTLTNVPTDEQIAGKLDPLKPFFRQYYAAGFYHGLEKFITQVADDPSLPPSVVIFAMKLVLSTDQMRDGGDPPGFTAFHTEMLAKLQGHAAKQRAELGGTDG